MRYAYLDYSLLDFPADSIVVDVGCGSGRFLAALQERGIQAVGVEPNSASVDACKAKGLTVIHGSAEKLPVDDASCDGLICNVALPFMDERKAVAEWARVLKRGGEARVVGHGFGYALWLVQNAPFVESKVYGGKMFIATLAYRALGKRIGPICQTTGRMRTYYRRTGLELVHVDESQRCMGFPVVVFHRVRKP